MTQSMHGLQPLLAFAETAKRGNFAAASREIGCTPSTLAKAVSRLEARLGLRLFHRTTRQVTLTDDGQRLFARCQRVLAELEMLQEEASGARDEPSGTLRIDMAVSITWCRPTTAARRSRCGPTRPARVQARSEAFSAASATR